MGNLVMAMIAHDGKKPEMVAFAHRNRRKLGRYRLVATGTTGKMLIEQVGLQVAPCSQAPTAAMLRSLPVPPPARCRLSSFSWTRSMPTPTSQTSRG